MRVPISGRRFIAYALLAVWIALTLDAVGNSVTSYAMTEWAVHEALTKGLDTPSPDAFRDITARGEAIWVCLTLLVSALLAERKGTASTRETT